MHFSLPNNRPLEQGSHWEESDCNLVHQTPKLPAIISPFLHQTQAYTDSQANLSCNTRDRSNLLIFWWAGTFGVSSIMEAPCVDRQASCDIYRGAGESLRFHSVAEGFVAWHGNNTVCFQSEWYKPETHCFFIKNNLLTAGLTNVGHVSDWKAQIPTNYLSHLITGPVLSFKLKYEIDQISLRCSCSYCKAFQTLCLSVHVIWDRFSLPVSSSKDASASLTYILTSKACLPLIPGTRSSPGTHNAICSPEAGSQTDRGEWVCW